MLTLTMLLLSKPEPPRPWARPRWLSRPGPVTTDDQLPPIHLDAQDPTPASSRDVRPLGLLPGRIVPLRFR